MKGNMYSPKNRLRGNEICCAKHFLESNFYQLGLLTKYQFFKKLPQIPHIHKICSFICIIGIY